MNEEDSVKFVQDKLTRDYNEITGDARKLIQNKYDKVMAARKHMDLF